MGLITLGASLLRGAGSLLGIGGTAATQATARAAGGGILSTIGRVLTNPFAQSVAGGAIGAGVITGIGGDGAVAPFGMGGGDFAGTGPGAQLAQIAAAGGQITPLANGQFMAIAPNGDMQIFNRNGMPRRPSMIIPAGQRLPGGSIVVATRNNGSQIGIVKRRRRRAFGTEIRRVRRTVQAANALVNLCKPAKRRA